MNIVLRYSVLLSLFYTTSTAPQQPEEKENLLDITAPVTENPEVQNVSVKLIEKQIVIAKPADVSKVETVPDVGLSLKVYRIITEPLIKIVRTPKVNAVLRNIGTCLVNGAMELFTFYLPPPFMPLIATVAGLVIPFEPVVMLKEKMPVTSYRRAFSTAMNSFLRTFDQYKMEAEYDPYMTRSFNRRFMDDGNKKNKL